MATTEFFAWAKPIIDGSPGSWDTILNTLFDAADSDVNDIKTTADAAFKSDGTIAMTGEIDVLTERYTLVTTGTSGAVSLDMDAANFFALTPSASVTLSITNVPATGDVAFIQIEITNGAAQTITWPSSVDWPDATAPTLTAGVDLITGYTRDGGTTWRLALAMENSS